MNARTSSWLRGLKFFVAPVALVLTTMVLPGALAQSSDASAGGVRLGTVRAPFLVARSYGMSYAPTRVATVDLNHDGKLDLITADVTTGKVTVHLGTGSGMFQAGTEFACGCHPAALAVADLGDGEASVVLGDALDGKVRVLSVGSSGALALKASYSTGLVPALLVAGNFGGNGGADIALVGGKVNTLAVLLNDGNGNLSKPVTIALGKTPASLAAGDLSGGGRMDLAIGNTDGTVSILAARGNGGFQLRGDVIAGVGVVSAVAVGDFDHDGKIDLAVTEASGNAVSVLLGKGDGSFGASHRYAVGNEPGSAVVADVNGDGNADLVAVNRGSNSFSVLTGDGDGTFRESADFVVGKEPEAGVVGDFDGDGRADFAVIDGGSQAISVALGNGDGSFRAGRSYGAELMPLAAAAGDLNGDQRTDLVVANYCGSDAGCAKGGSVSVFLADSNGVYKLAHSYAVGAGPVTAALMDTDGDGIPDIVALNRLDKTITVLPGTGDGSFEAGSTLSLTDSPVAAVVGDFNGDGKLDLAVLGDCGAANCQRAGSVEVLLALGGGGFRSGAIYPVGFGPVAIAAGNLNNDKTTDLVIANRCGADASCKSVGTATVLLGAGSGRFATAGASTGAIAIGKSPAGIALGDLSGRGVLDMVVSRTGDNTVATLRGNGNGTFGAAASYAVGGGPGAIVLGDFDGDGKLDVAVANASDATVSVLFGTGSGRMGSSAVMPVGAGPAALTAVAGSAGKATALVTANANASSTQPGSEITVLTRLHPEAGGSTKPSVSVALTTGTSPATFGTALTFTATVTGPTGTTQPTGTVTFADSGTTLTCTGSGDNALTQNGTTDSTATCTISTLSVAVHAITASYVAAAADPTYIDAGPSTSIPETITKATPLIGLARTTGSASVSYGTSLTFTATVTGLTGMTQPTGTVTFKDGATTLSCTGAGDNTLTQNGTTNSTATCSLSTLAVAAHSITASYVPGSDPIYALAGPSNTVAQTVTTAGPSIQLTRTTGAASVTFGTSLTFTATLAGPTGQTQPTGTVAFKDGATVLTCTGAGDNTLTQNGTTNSTATCTDATLGGGTHSITASYAPGSDPNYAASGPSNTVSQTITGAPATLSWTSSATVTPTVDQSVTFTATITPNTATTTKPSGTVSFTINGNANLTDCPNATVNSSAKATCTTAALVYPADLIAATYSNDTYFTVSNPPTYTQSVNKAASAVSFSPVTPVPTVNQQVMFTASVAPATGLATEVLPGGNVSFKQGTTVLCGSAGLNGSAGATAATATCTATFSTAFPAGTPITVTYLGDGNFTGGAQTINQVIAKGKTVATIVSATPSPSSAAQQVLFTTTVTANPTGTASPQSGSISLSYTTSTNSTPTAMCTETITGGVVPACPFTFTSSGTYNVTAVFTSTDSNFSDSPASAVFPQTVGPSTTTISVSNTPSSTPLYVNQAVKFTATVSSSGATPVGTIAFIDSSTGSSLCPAAPLTAQSGSNPPAATASCTAPSATVGPLKAGAHTIQATFNPSNTGAFNSAIGTTTVAVSQNVPNVSVALAGGPATVSVDQKVTFTATIAESAGGLAANASSVLYPTGSVSFTYTQANVTTANPCTSVAVSTDVNGVTTASCPFAFPSAAAAGQPFTVNAIYTGDGNFTAGTPGVATQVVMPTGTTINPPTLSFGASGPVVNQPITFSTTVSSTIPDKNLTVPTGAVTFKDSGTTICSGNVDASGAASCTAPLSTQGAHSITASYGGDGNFNKSDSTAVSQLVQTATVTVGVSSPTLAPATPAVATQALIFTAKITPAFANPAIPTGSVIFTASDGSPNGCGAVPVTPSDGGTAIAGCSFGFLPTTSGNVTVTATYTSGDANFGSSAGSFVKVVQNFTIAFSQTSALTLTPGYSNTTDPFNPTAVTFNSTPLQGYSDNLTVSCLVQDSQGHAVSSAVLACAPGSTTLSGSGVTPGTFTVTAAASAPLDQYTVTLTATDNLYPQLSHTTTMLVDVVSKSAIYLLTAASAGVQNVPFNTANPLGGVATGSIVSVTCDQFTTLSGSGTITAGQVTCTGPAASVPITSFATDVAVTVALSGSTTTTQLQREHRDGLALAALWGVPLLAALAWVGGFRAKRDHLLKLLGVVLLAIGFLHTIGCGSNLTKPLTATGGPAAGTYLIEVVATDSNGVKHFATATLEVNTGK